MASFDDNGEEDGGGYHDDRAIDVPSFSSSSICDKDDSSVFGNGGWAVAVAVAVAGTAGAGQSELGRVEHGVHGRAGWRKELDGEHAGPPERAPVPRQALVRPWCLGPLLLCPSCCSCCRSCRSCSSTVDRKKVDCHCHFHFDVILAALVRQWWWRRCQAKGGGRAKGNGYGCASGNRGKGRSGISVGGIGGIG